MITIKLTIASTGGKVQPNPQINPILGQNGIAVDQFCKAATEKIKHYEDGIPIRLRIKKKETKETEITIKGPVHKELLLKSKIDWNKTQYITLPQIYELARLFSSNKEEVILASKQLYKTAQQLKIVVLL